MRSDRRVRGERPASRWSGRRQACMLMLAGMIFAVACVNNDPPELDAEPVPPTYLRVENQAFLDMNVYVLHRGERIRLGTVTGTTTTRLLIPKRLLFGPTSLAFYADPIGGNRSPISQEITVSAGDEVTLTIPPR